MKTRQFRAPDGAEWQVAVRMPGASNAMVMFQDRGGRDRYAWYLNSGIEARDVTARLDPEAVLASLGDDQLTRLFRRSMAVSRPVPAVEPG